MRSQPDLHMYDLYHARHSGNEIIRLLWTPIHELLSNLTAFAVLANSRSNQGKKRAIQKHQNKKRPAKRHSKRQKEISTAAKKKENTTACRPVCAFCWCFHLQHLSHK